MKIELEIPEKSIIPINTPGAYLHNEGSMKTGWREFESTGRVFHEVEGIIGIGENGDVTLGAQEDFDHAYDFEEGSWKKISLREKLDIANEMLIRWAMYREKLLLEMGRKNEN